MNLPKDLKKLISTKSVLIGELEGLITCLPRKPIHIPSHESPPNKFTITDEYKVSREKFLSGDCQNCVRNPGKGQGQISSLEITLTKRIGATML